MSAVTFVDHEPQVFEPPAEVLVRRLTTVSGEVRALTHAMREACMALPVQHQQEVLQAINDWERVFTTKNPTDFQTDDERITAARALCFFLFNTIEYVMLQYAGSDEEKIRWHGFGKDLTNIVEMILPPEMELNLFIDTFKKNFVQGKLLFACKQKIHVLFQRITQGLYAYANEVDRKRVIGFESLKTALMAVTAEQEASLQDVYALVDSLNHRVEQLFQELQECLHQAQNMGEKLQLQERILQQILQECLQTVGRASK